LKERRVGEVEGGIYKPFTATHPELALDETRSLMLSGSEGGVPDGEYGFLETFCSGRTCDCRRVIFQVFRNTGGAGGRQGARPVVHIGYGWEPTAFYTAWIHGDEELGEALKGPVIDPLSPACSYGPELLDLFVRTCLSDREYTDRVARHYELFKEALR